MKMTDQHTSSATMAASLTGRPTSERATGGVVLDGAIKRYAGNDHAALDVPLLRLPAGALTVVVGPSGCGKSTALRAIAGLETLTEGRVVIDGMDVTGVPPGRRGVAMVFQDFALYPHMSVERNISFGLRLAAKHNRHASLGRTEIERRVAEVCATLGLSDLRHRRPAQLSGGERQRVGVARAIVRRPPVLLLDEPLSALDAQLRHNARAELVRLHRELGNTVVLVTHDQLEALSMATHLVVMNAGRVLQTGTPSDVYNQPMDTFVATFVGSPPMNLHTATVTDGGHRLSGPGIHATLSRPLVDGTPEMQVGWRPGEGVIEDVDEIGAARPGPGLLVEGVIDVIEFIGDSTIVRCTGESGQWAVLVPAKAAVPAVRQRVRVRIPPAQLHLFDPATGVRLSAQPRN